MRVIYVIFIIACLTVGCSNRECENKKRKLSTRERDSILAESKLPGARVVGKALSVSDSLDARTKRMESLINEGNNN
jgi:hypothetical protein